MMSGELYCKNCFKKKFKARGRYDDITKVVPGTQAKPKPAGGAPAPVEAKMEAKTEAPAPAPAEAKTEETKAT